MSRTKPDGSGISSAGILAAVAIHVVILSALLYGAHETLRETAPPLLVDTGSVLTVHRDFDTVGTWQGSLVAGSRKSSVVVRITDARVRCGAETWGMAEDGSQGSKANGAVTLEGSVLRIMIPSLQGQFHGSVSKDGTAIRGTWTAPNSGVESLELRRADSEAALRDLAMCR